MLVKQWSREWKDKFYIRKNENRYLPANNLFYIYIHTHLFYYISTHLIFITTPESSFIEPILWLKKPRLRELVACPMSLSRKVADRLLPHNRKAQCLVSETYVNPVTSGSFHHGRATLIIAFGPKHYVTD